MIKKFLQQQKKELEKKKKQLKQELKTFAKRDFNIKGNWETKFTDFGSRTADPAEEQDQIEEYEANLPVEYTLESELKKVEKALTKIQKGTYGFCEKCGKKIRTERLKVYPEADTCAKCSK